MNLIRKAILPVGFKASAVSCGLKKNNKLDLALFYSSIPAKASCKFTTNKIVAAPVILDKGYLKAGGNFQAIIVNSGNANAFTGKSGIVDARNTSLVVARELGIAANNVLVASTGIIGKKLAFEKIQDSTSDLINGLSLKGIAEAKTAIMTTDTFAKEATVRFTAGGKKVTVCGIAKGAGMIAPNMATMLAFIFTDANISQAALDKTLSVSVNTSFNCITVDGCMSTNDSVMLLANGAAGNKAITAGNDLALFSQALNSVCLELAKMVVKDAEGATKFIRIKVTGATSIPDARKAGLSIANSALFKTAIYGENPNFGRIVSAVGASGIEVKENDIKIKAGALHKKEIDINVAVGKGKHEAVIYTSDLTPEYVKINAEYN